MRITIILTVILFFSLSTLSSAAGFTNPVWDGSSFGGYPVACNVANTPCTACDAIMVGINLTNFGSIIIFPIVTIIAIYGGFQMLISAGSEERFRSGKNTLISGIVGLAIVLIAWLAINTFLHLLAGSPLNWSALRINGCI